MYNDKAKVQLRKGVSYDDATRGHSLLWPCAYDGNSGVPVGIGVL